MTEEDTFDALRKWDYARLCEALTKNSIANGGHSEVLRILRFAGWTQRELIDEFTKNPR